MNEQLINASIVGDLRAVEQGLAGGANIECKAANGWTPLLVASWHGHPVIVKKLLAVGANANIVVDKKFAPLLLAAVRGHTAVVEMLLSAGAIIEQVDNTNSTSLLIAAYEGHTTIVQHLLLVGANLDQLDNSGNSVLCNAAMGNQLDVARLLLEADADPHIRNNQGQTAADIFQTNGNTTAVKLLCDYASSSTTKFFCAIRRGHMEIVRQLAEGEGVNCRGKNGTTPLHVAAQYGQYELAKRLIEQGANLTARADSGRTPLHLACAKGDISIVKFMIDHGARLSIADDHGLKPLDMAARYGHQVVVCELVARGANLLSVANDGRTILHHATRSHNAALVEYVLRQYGVNVNAGDEHHQTPLHYAVQEMNLDHPAPGAPVAFADTTSETRRLAVLNLLLAAKGINVNAQNDKGETPLMMAISSRLHQSISMLINSGVDLNISKHKGETAMSIASNLGNTAVLRQLWNRGARTFRVGDSSSANISSVVNLYHNSYEFHNCCFNLVVNTTTTPTRAQVQELVSLISSVYDLRFILAMKGLCDVNESASLLQASLEHVVASRLIYDDETCVFFKLVLEYCEREKVLPRATCLLLDRKAEQFHRNSVDWALEMKKQVHRKSWQIAVHEHHLHSLVDIVRQVHAMVMDNRTAMKATVERVKSLQSQVCEGKQLLSHHISRAPHLDQRLTQSDENVSSIVSLLSNHRCLTIHQEESSKWTKLMCRVVASISGFVLCPKFPIVSDKIVDFMSPMEIVIGCGVRHPTKFLLKEGGEYLSEAIQHHLLEIGIKPEAFQDLLREGIALTHPELIDECAQRGLGVPMLGASPNLVRSAKSLLDAETTTMSKILKELRLEAKGNENRQGESVATVIASVTPYALQQIEGQGTVQLVWAQDGEHVYGRRPSEPPASVIPIARPVDTCLLSPEQKIIGHVPASATADISPFTSNESSVELLSDSTAFPYHFAVKECLGDIAVFQEITKNISDDVNAGATMEVRVTYMSTTHDAICAAQYAYLRGHHAVGDAIVARMTNPPVFDNEPAMSIILKEDLDDYPYVMFVVESDGDVDTCQDFMDTLDEADAQINQQIQAVIVHEHSYQVLWTVYEYAAHLGYGDLVKYLFKKVCKDVPTKTRIQVMKQVRERSNSPVDPSSTSVAM